MSGLASTSRTHSGVAWVVGAVLALVAATGIGVGTAPRADAATTARCAAGSSDHVAVVVDFGTAVAVPGAPGGIFTACVPANFDGVGGVPTTGLAALRTAVGGRLAFDSSSKICAIAGYPRDPDPVNCSAPVNGRVRYWSYYLGTPAGWGYSNVGSAGRRVVHGVVEGWRYVDSPAGGDPGRMPPRRLPDGRSSSVEANICVEVRPPTPTVTAPRPTSPRADPGQDGASSSGSDGAPASGGAGTGTPRAGRGPTTTAGGDQARGRESASTVPSGSPTSTPIEGDERAARVLTRAELDANAREAADHRASSGPLPTVLVGIVLLAVAGAGTWIARRRRGPT